MPGRYRQLRMRDPDVFLLFPATSLAHRHVNSRENAASEIGTRISCVGDAARKQRTPKAVPGLVSKVALDNSYHLIARPAEQESTADWRAVESRPLEDSAFHGARVIEIIAKFTCSAFCRKKSLSLRYPDE